MFTQDQPKRQIAAIGEIQLIERIRSWLGPINPPAPFGIGDDCAIIEAKPELEQIITTDALTYRQHFDDTVSAEAAGAKLIKRNLSDLAAMGGSPTSAVLAVLSGPDLEIDWLEAFFKGIRQACMQYQVKLIGGDLSSLTEGNFSAVLTLIGQSTQPRFRSTAKQGDRIYVTGSLGGSILEKHYTFEPRLKEGQWLAAQADCTAMMDLTDGLSKDLPALTPEGCAASLDLSKIPIAEDAHTLAIRSERRPIEHAFNDGEDYELLFTLSKSADCETFEANWKAIFPELSIQCIGEFDKSDETGLRCQQTNEPIPWARGFEHFNK